MATDIKASLFVLCAADLVVGSVVSASLLAAAATFRLAYIIHYTNTNSEPLQAESARQRRCRRSKKRCNAKKSDYQCEKTEHARSVALLREIVGAEQKTRQTMKLSGYRTTSMRGE
ncbi:MAG: hypothetical protein KIT76_01105 [Pseudolabrys sp.]|nr:hypothetical protein [Pseudolabrys sp.]